MIYDGSADIVCTHVQSPGTHTSSKAAISLAGRARSASQHESALSRDDQDTPACFSGESNDSHVERVTSHVGLRPCHTDPLHLEPEGIDTCDACMVVSITRLGPVAARCLFERMTETILKALLMWEAQATAAALSEPARAQARSDGREMTEAEHEEMRLKRIQEKNRRNQRKFRARQRVSAEHLRSDCCKSFLPPT